MPLSATEAILLVWTPPSKTRPVEGRPGGNPLVVAFGTQRGRCPDAVWVVSSAFLLCFCLLHYSILVLVMSTEAMMTVWTPLLSAETVRRGYIIRQCYRSCSGGSFETQDGCCPRRWLDGVICFGPSCWPAVSALFSTLLVPSCFPRSFQRYFPSVSSFFPTVFSVCFFSFFLAFSFLFYLFFFCRCKQSGVLLACIYSFARVFIAVGIARPITLLCLQSVSLSRSL